MEQQYTLGEFVRTRVDFLSTKFEKAESHYMVRVLLEEYFGIDRVKIVLEPNILLTNEQVAMVDAAIAQLMKDVPLQYVIGEMEFFELRFKVAEGVLIPRPETEEMVGLICRQFARDQRLNILDIGTGSGCIAISLASWFVNANICAIDISEKALEIARYNAEKNNVNINFVKKDILATTSLANSYDLIISNPPYVCEKEKSLMQANVLNYEPAQALFVPDDNPLLFYNQIALLTSKALNNDGQLWFEINEAYGEATKQCCYEVGFNDVEIMTDFREKPRFCKAIKQ